MVRYMEDDKVRITVSLRPLGVANGEQYIGRIGTIVQVLDYGTDKVRYRIRFDNMPRTVFPEKTVTWSIVPAFFVVVEPASNIERIW